MESKRPRALDLGFSGEFVFLPNSAFNDMGSALLLFRFGSPLFPFFQRICVHAVCGGFGSFPMFARRAARDHPHSRRG